MFKISHSIVSQYYNTHDVNTCISRVDEKLPKGNSLLFLQLLTCRPVIINKVE